MSAETTFKGIVYTLISLGVYPSPGKINKGLRRNRKNMNQLSGKECKWREEVFAWLGPEHWVNIRHEKNVLDRS